MTSASHRHPRRLPQRLSRMDAWRKWRLLVEANTRLLEQERDTERPERCCDGEFCGAWDSCREAHDDGPSAA